MTANLTHVRLLVDDFAACYGSYRDVIGLTPRFGAEQGPYEESAAGAVLLALFQGSLRARALGASPDAARSSGCGALVLCLGVPDVDRAHAELQARSARFLVPPSDRREWMIRTAHLRDPAGSLVELSAPLSSAGPR